MASKRKKEKHAVPLSDDKVVAAIEGIKKPSLRKKAEAHFGRKLNGKPMPNRHGSPAESRKLTRKGKPELAVTDEEREDMAELYSSGPISYREGERIFHLKDANGNDFYRQVNNICAEDEAIRKRVRAECLRTGQPIPEKAKTEKDKEKDKAKAHA